MVCCLESFYLFRQQQPHLNIQLMELSTTEQLQALKKAALMFGVWAFKNLVIPREANSLRKERLVVSAHTSHQLHSAQKGYIWPILD